MIAQKGGDRRDQEHAGHRRLQAEAQDILRRQPRLQVDGVIEPEPAHRQHPRQCRMGEEQQGREQQPAQISYRPLRDGFEDRNHRLKIDAQHQDLIDVKEFLVPQAESLGNQRAEDRRRVGGVRQPVVVQLAAAALGQAMQEVLMLVRVIERRLGVGDPERAGPTQEVEHGLPARKCHRGVPWLGQSGTRIIAASPGVSSLLFP